MSKYYALRFRSGDTLHHKGDIKLSNRSLFYIGQTRECDLQIVSHPEWEDACYAVIALNEDAVSWRIVRMEKEADIQVNGVPLDLVRNLKHGDLLQFDNTLVRFTVEDGEMPAVQYIRHKRNYLLYALFCFLLVIVSGIIYSMQKDKQKSAEVFRNEVESIYKLEADTLLVLTADGDTLDILQADKTEVGTGFVTTNGYFVTARHCIEFWLNMENHLEADFNSISSDIVRRAIEAETDSTLRLVAKLRITSRDEKRVWYLSSEDFTIDRSHDNVYEFGNFDSSYLWRSVISRYENREAELGDVAVMKWETDGTIELAEPNVLLQKEDPLVCFGYPQNETALKADFAAAGDVKIYKYSDPQSSFYSDKGLDPGFSGSPVFSKNDKKVIGIVSRSDNANTLIVPVGQVYQLIKTISDGNRQ